jgi:hypothetical protein
LLLRCYRLKTTQKLEFAFAILSGHFVIRVMALNSYNPPGSKLFSTSLTVPLILLGISLVIELSSELFWSELGFGKALRHT